MLACYMPGSSSISGTGDVALGLQLRPPAGRSKCAGAQETRRTGEEAKEDQEKSEERNAYPEARVTGAHISQDRIHKK